MDSPQKKKKVAKLLKEKKRMTEKIVVTFSLGLQLSGIFLFEKLVVLINIPVPLVLVTVCTVVVLGKTPS